MKWTGFTGGWMRINSEIEQAVRGKVRMAMEKGNGVAVGGALGVDYFVLDEALKFDPTAEKIKVFIPIPFEAYLEYLKKGAESGFMDSEQVKRLVEQLIDLKLRRAASLIDGVGEEAKKETFAARNKRIVETADELVAFHIVSELSDGPGTRDTIGKAQKKGIPVEVIKYDLTSSV